MEWEETNINIDDPIQILNLYSDRIFNIKDYEKLNSAQLEILFVHLVSDFYDHSISVDILTSAASIIFDSLGDNRSGKFGGLLISISDIDYNLRQTSNIDEKMRTTSSILNEMHEFYISHKNILQEGS